STMPVGTQPPLPCREDCRDKYPGGSPPSFAPMQVLELPSEGTGVGMPGSKPGKPPSLDAISVGTVEVDASLAKVAAPASWTTVGATASSAESTLAASSPKASGDASSPLIVLNPPESSPGDSGIGGGDTGGPVTIPPETPELPPQRLP